MSTLELTFASGESSLSVRKVAIHEALSSMFTVSVWARSPDPSIDLESLVGKDASLRVAQGDAHATGGHRVYTGVVQYMEMARAESETPVLPGEAKGLSTYQLVIVPKLWLLTQRLDYRIYQHLAIPDIVDRLLAGWQITPEWRIDRGKYPALEYKVQYEETDHDFLSRLLEEAGITLWFDDQGGVESKLVLGDTPHQNPRRPGPPLPYVATPNLTSGKELVTQVHLGHEVRPGAHVIRDVDFRRPALALLGQASSSSSSSGTATSPGGYEQFHYRPGAFSIEPGAGGDTPAADDRGIMRHDGGFGQGRAGRGLLADRGGRRAVAFDASVVDLRPGTVFASTGHAHPELEGKELLVTSFSLDATLTDEWTISGQAVFTDAAYVPAATTPRPEVIGVQTATVVGPGTDEIHTDEFGRVRVQFPWDREGKMDETACCWIRPNQGWGGSGWGWLVLPRVGQEVLVAFIEGDPDQPVVVSRLYNAGQVVPYDLPDYKTQSTWKSNSSPNADGYNEIRFDDLKDSEEVYFQAQKNLRKLVKNDETITVGNDRGKSVGNDETDTTGNDRTEVTNRDRSETTNEYRTIAIGGDRRKLIQENETDVTQGSRRSLTHGDLDVVVKGARREQICDALDSDEGDEMPLDPDEEQEDLPPMHDGDHHLVNGARRERIALTQSLTVGQDQQESVGGSHALSAGQQIHLSATNLFVGDAPDITLIGAGGFVRIDGSGVIVSGTRVEINVSGTPGKGQGSKPVLPDAAKKAEITSDEGDG